MFTFPNDSATVESEFNDLVIEIGMSVKKKQIFYHLLHLFLQFYHQYLIVSNKTLHKQNVTNKTTIVTRLDSLSFTIDNARKSSVLRPRRF